jgi:hypothetical protein
LATALLAVTLVIDLCASHVTPRVTVGVTVVIAK